MPVRSLRDDYYEYDERTARLVGERSGRGYSLGQPVRVTVASVDTMARTIDFELYKEEKSERSDKKEQPERRKTLKRLTAKGEIPAPKKDRKHRKAHRGGGRRKK